MFACTTVVDTLMLLPMLSSLKSSHFPFASVFSGLFTRIFVQSFCYQVAVVKMDRYHLSLKFWAENYFRYVDSANKG